MTPPRFATIVLTVMLLLPISPDAKAMIVPSADALTVATLTGFPLVERVFNEAFKPAEVGAEIPATGPLWGHKIQCGCLYLDWWYETPGLWVTLPTNAPIPI